VGEPPSPLLIAVCGAPASGKTQLSRTLAAVLGLSHLSADVIRKQLSGGDPEQRAAPERFSAESRNSTYRELGRRAATDAADGRGAVVSAAFAHRADRAAFTSAVAGAAPVVFVECTAPAEVLAERGAGRDGFPWRTSDGMIEAVRDVLAGREPLDEIAGERRLTVRTDRPPEDVVADVLAMLDRRAGAS
jgi:uncharacterized protein